MNSDNGTGGIYIEGFAFERSPGIPCAIIRLDKSSSALRGFLANLHNTETQLEQMLNLYIYIYGDWRARLITIPNHENGYIKFNYLMNPDETKDLATRLQQIGTGRLEGITPLEHRGIVKDSLEAFVAKYT